MFSTTRFDSSRTVPSYREQLPQASRHRLCERMCLAGNDRPPVESRSSVFTLLISTTKPRRVSAPVLSDVPLAGAPVSRGERDRSHGLGNNRNAFLPTPPSPRRCRAQSLKELASGTTRKLGRALKKEKIYRCFFPPQRNVTTLKSPLNC